MKTILVVDDSRTARQYHAAILTSSGYSVVLASEGSEALEKLLLHNVDLILTDLNMEGMDGLELISRARAIDNYRSVPIAVVSTDRDEAERTKGLRAGANLFVAKPCEPKQLLRYVAMMLGEG